ASGLLQCAVVGYGFWLTRRFGVARVGWALVFTFSLLALLRAFLVETSMEVGLKVNIMFGVISLLLLAGMVQLEILLRQRQHMELARHKAQTELEASVEKKTAERTRLNDELQQTTER